MRKKIFFTIESVVLLLLPGLWVVPSAAGGACELAPGPLREAVMRFAPVIVQRPEIPAAPEAMLYRAATSGDGRLLLIAYHVVWPYEQDPRPGFWPAVTRAVYTGGLRLQSVIYGPGDVEVIELEVDLETMKLLRVSYETADYDARGGVIHVQVVKEGDKLPDQLPLYFEVVSWNHLFELRERPPAPDQPVHRLEPRPFTEELWVYYRMSKSVRTPLSRDRDQRAWETGGICPFP